MRSTLSGVGCATNNAPRDSAMDSKCCTCGCATSNPRSPNRIPSIGTGGTLNADLTMEPPLGPGSIPGTSSRINLSGSMPSGGGGLEMGTVSLPSSTRADPSDWPPIRSPTGEIGTGIVGKDGRAFGLSPSPPVGLCVRVICPGCAPPHACAPSTFTP